MPNRSLVQVKNRKRTMRRTKPLAVEVPVFSWEQARRISRALYGWAFRGQSNASHGLSSSIERAANRSAVELKWLVSFEGQVLQEFQRRAHHYMTDLPPKSAILEWLALLQHHGAPTRLLDFTESFYIAAFFACEFADRDAAVWAINTPALRLILAKKAGIDTKDPAAAAIEFDMQAVEFCEQAFRSETPEALAVPVRPWTLNQRISLQQGLFLFPLDLARPFEANLAATLSLRPDLFRNLPRLSINKRSTYSQLSVLSKYRLVKFVIPKDRIMRVQNDLELMNISAATLFPGLDGFARSLHGQVGWRSVYDAIEES
jgi:FRG domain